jgi:type II secretory pathway pseudopilin PulG
MALSVGVMVLIAGMSVPVYQAFQNRNDLDIAATTFAQSLRRAQALSQAVDGDSPWGVNIGSGSITVFKGASYAARDASFDEVFAVPTSIAVSGTSGIVFAKMTGAPQTTGTTVLTSSTNETRSITINTKGMVAY